jgi:hypothetical protein
MARTTDLPVSEPPFNRQSMGSVGVRAIRLAHIWIADGIGAPSNGTTGDGAGWMGKGSLYVDANTGLVYANTNTRASPTWTKVGTQT